MAHVVLMFSLRFRSLGFRVHSSEPITKARRRSGVDFSRRGKTSCAKRRNARLGLLLVSLNPKPIRKWKEGISTVEPMESPIVVQGLGLAVLHPTLSRINFGGRFRSQAFEGGLQTFLLLLVFGRRALVFSALLGGRWGCRKACTVALSVERYLALAFLYEPPHFLWLSGGISPVFEHSTSGECKCATSPNEDKEGVMHSL